MKTNYVVFRILHYIVQMYLLQNILYSTTMGYHIRKYQESVFTIRIKGGFLKPSIRDPRDKPTLTGTLQLYNF